MNNPYDNFNGSTDTNVNDETNTNQASNEPETKADTSTEAKTSGEYHMSGNEIPKAEPTVNSANVNNQAQSTVNSQPYQQRVNTNPQPTYTHTQQSYYGQPQQPQYHQNNAYQQNSYTWGQQQTPPAQPMYQHQAPKAPKQKKQKSGSSFGVKIVALVLCCLISSGASVGVMALLIKNGVIGNNNSSDTESAAYTITKIIDGSSSDSSDDDSSSSSDGALTRQEIAAKLVPSVVCVQNYQVSTNNYSDYFSNYFGYGSSGSSSNDSSDSSTEVDPAGEGSGIIFQEKDNETYILTNAHVVEDATSLKVITSDNTSYEATLVGSDDVSDLAVIKIEATGLTIAEFGSSDDLAVGDQVIAIGNPGGSAFSSSVTVGYVSALNREITTESGYTMYCIQTDAAINPGNSGGALVNQYGQVIGINSSKIVSTGYEGLGFAIPSDTAQPIATSLINYGYIKDRAALGISGTYVDSMTAQWYGLSSGMYVASVNSDEAQASGLEKGDVITSIDGTDVTSSTTITSVVTQKKPGDTVTLKVDRALTGESDLEITVTLTEHVEDSDDSSDSSSSSDNNSDSNGNSNGSGNAYGYGNNGGNQGR